MHACHKLSWLGPPHVTATFFVLQDWPELYAKFQCQLIAYPHPFHSINKSIEDTGYSTFSQKLCELVTSTTHEIKSLGIQIMHCLLNLQQTHWILSLSRCSLYCLSKCSPTDQTSDLFIDLENMVSKMIHHMDDSYWSLSVCF